MVAMRRLLSNGAKRMGENKNLNHAPSVPLRYNNSDLSDRVGHFSSATSTWSCLIGTLTKGGIIAELALFEAPRLLRYGTKPNAYALAHLLRATTNLGWDSLGHQLHSYSLRSGYYSNVFVSAALARFYVGVGSLSDAHKLFAEIPQSNVVSWNTLISGYVHSGQFRKALSVLLELERSGIHADAFSFTSGLAACGQLGFLKLGMSIHSKVLKIGLVSGTVVANCLIDMYGKCGSVEEAVRVFSEINDKNIISWNSVIAASANNGNIEQAFHFLSKCKQKDEFTFSIVLKLIACLSSLTWGMLIHCCTIKCGVDTSLFVGNSLIHMYSKCGQVKNAESIFHSLPSRNLVSWNAVISGYARNGYYANVIQLFEQLKTERHIKPDGITFLNLFCACYHNQIPFVIATQYFNSMIRDYGIAPTIEHCCSIIRLMGQKGELWRAERMIQELGFDSCGLVWRALLGACESCRNLEVAEVAAAKLMELECNEDYVYVMISKLYASYGRWEDAHAMRKNKVTKDAGSSWIRVEKSVPLLPLLE